MRSRNSTIYTGKVGAKMKAPTLRKERATKIGYSCKDGPLAGERLFLSGDGCTMVLNFGGQVGRYVRGQWEPSCT